MLHSELKEQEKPFDEGKGRAGWDLYMELGKWIGVQY